MNKVLLVGSGYMGLEYAKVLNYLGVPFEVVGRRKEKIRKFNKHFPKIKTYSGGIGKYLMSNMSPKTAIVAVNPHELYKVTKELINRGAKKILVEKPGGISLNQIKDLIKLSRNKGVKIFIGYNRRFYQSVNLAKKIIEKDKGIKSVHFEFTEWIHMIDPKKYDKSVLEKWVAVNSSHVIDLVFHLCGKPKRLHSLVYGNHVNWHPSGSIFIGSGVTEKEIPFTYHSNWGSPGRWSIEILTSRHRLYFEPLERLKLQEIGSVELTEMKGDYSMDINFKPGLFNQVKAFLGDSYDIICTIDEQLKNFILYEKIGGYR